MSLTARTVVLLDNTHVTNCKDNGSFGNLHVTSCKDDGATLLHNLDFFLKPPYAPHPAHPQVMMQTADNVL